MQARPWEDNHPVREIGSPAVRRQSIGPPCHGHHDPGRDASRQPKPQGEGPQGILATCSASGSLGNRMCGCPRSFEVRGTVITASLSKEKQDESQQARHGRGRPVSRAPAGGEPGIGSGRRWPATLVARCPHRFLPAVKVPRGAAAASRLGRHGDLRRGSAPSRRSSSWPGCGTGSILIPTRSSSSCPWSWASGWSGTAFTTSSPSCGLPPEPGPGRRVR
jgi:hypothetical protein